MSSNLSSAAVENGSILDLGLRLTGVEEVLTPGVPAGQVLASKPAAGTTVAEGSGVDITVAAAPDATPRQSTPRPTVSP